MSGMREILVFSAAAAIAIGATWRLVRRFGAPGATLSDLTPELFGAAGTIYGLIITFALSFAWDDWQRTRRVSQSELNAVGTLRSVAGGLPEPTRGQLEAGCKTYIDGVLGPEWKALGAGRGSPEVRATEALLWRTVAGFAPQDDRERNLHLLALLSMRDISDHHALRVLGSVQRLPGMLWLVLGWGFLLLIAFGAVAGRRSRLQLGLYAAVLMLAALTLFSIHGLDAPFEPPLAYGPREIWKTMELLNARESGAAQRRPSSQP